jgi:plastocyanin
VKSQSKTKYIKVTDSGFTPSTQSVSLGTTVQWNFFGPSGNSVTDGTGMGLFGSGAKAPVSYFRFAYIGAGQYSVVDGLGHTMLVTVAPKAKPASGTVSTPFTITWSSATAPAGFVFDVQVLRPGSSTWTNWLTGQTAKSGAFTPDAGTGTYQFRALMRKLAGGSAANSPAKKITVS